MPQSTGVKAQELRQENQDKTYQPNDQEKAMCDLWRTRLYLAKQARNTPDRKLDMLTFIGDYYSNEDAVNSYLRPKKNDDDVRVVGGTTEKRIESIVNEMMSMNYQHEIQAFNMEDMFLESLGKAMEDAVTRTNQIEEDEETCGDAIWELASQRAVFVEEIVYERRVGKFLQKMLKKRVRSALEVIIGDPTMPAYKLQEQPFIATYDRMSYATARTFYGHKKNWKYVRGGMNLSVDVYGNDVTFRLGILQQDEVEIVHCMSVPENEECTFINGVPMDEPGTPLRFQYPFPRYPLAAAVPKRMGHHTFYGRSVPSSMKYLQAFSDETVRNLIRKFRQAIEPPRAVRSQERVYTRDIYVSGRITYGVDADAIKPLTDHNGITEGEMSMMNMIRQMQDEFAGRGAIQGGVTPSGKQTATATIEQQKQAIKMLGQLVLAYSSLVRQMTRNRLYSIIEVFSDPDSKEFEPATNTFIEQFRRFTLLDQPLETGKSGDKIVQLIGRNLSPKEHEAIEDWQEKQDRPTKLTVVNIKQVKEMAINWFIIAASKPKDSDDLQKIMFQEKLTQATAISQLTQKPMNGERVIDEFEMTWRAKDWFKTEDVEEQPMLDQMEAEAGQAGQSELGQGLTQGITAMNKKPAMPNPNSPKQLLGRPNQAYATQEQ